VGQAAHRPHETGQAAARAAVTEHRAGHVRTVPAVAIARPIVG